MPGKGPIDKSILQDYEFIHTQMDNVTRSIPVAAMITAYAQVFMYPFLSMVDNFCYYTDTDSIFVQKTLDEMHVGDKIGQFKFEGNVEFADFISPKTYYLQMADGRIIVKNKGVSSKMTFSDFQALARGEEVKK